MIQLALESGGEFPQLNRRPFFLPPGHLIVSDTPMAVTTILGSCVAVCLYDPIRGIGGMNHFMLPIQAPSHTASTRFGNVAMEVLVTRLVTGGAHRSSLLAEVFGGACMFTEMSESGLGDRHLGMRNIDVAVSHLDRLGIPITRMDVAGTRGRKLIFHTDEGVEWLNLI